MSFNIYSKIREKKYEICKSCNKNPVYDFEKCILCYDYTDVIFPSEEDIKYLKETDHLFELCGYDKHFNHPTEIWKCNTCKHYIEFLLYKPSLFRNDTHIDERRKHIDFICNKVINKQIYVEKDYVI